MRSVSLNLEKHVKSGLLHFFTGRPNLHGLEMHLTLMHKHIVDLKPAMVIVDPVSNFATAGEERDVHSMLVRLVDFMKMKTITSIFTNLTSGDAAKESTDMGISSIMDTWILVRDIELGGERNRGMYVLKSRGMQHSNQIREFVLSSKGIALLDVYSGAEGVLTGSARMSQEARERANRMVRDHETMRKQQELDRKKVALDAQIAALQAQFEAEHNRAMREIDIEQLQERVLNEDRVAMMLSRKADSTEASTKATRKRGSKP
jgi:circadian clock protein KaiC